MSKCESMTCTVVFIGVQSGCLLHLESEVLSWSFSFISPIACYACAYLTQLRSFLRIRKLCHSSLMFPQAPQHRVQGPIELNTFIYWSKQRVFVSHNKPHKAVQQNSVSCNSNKHENNAKMAWRVCS